MQANPWWSPNPDRADGERFFLLYSPLWMLMMAGIMLSGKIQSASDCQLLAHSLLVACPLLLPLLIRSRHGLRWYQRYVFKANLYIGLFNFFGNYVGSEYFFDVLGMVYQLPQASTVLDSAMVGSGQQRVPLIMYFYTQAYFITYHTTAIMVMRRLAPMQGPLRGVAIGVLSLVVGYVWAWIETRAMANPLMASTFYYRNMPAMLAYGSLIYANYFVASFPVFFFLDEHAGRRWSLWQVCGASLSASMLTFYALDVCARLISHLP